MKIKKHENPEFQVIKMDEANAKFYAASETPAPVPTDNRVVNGLTSSMNYGKNDANSWF